MARPRRPSGLVVLCLAACLLQASGTCAADARSLVVTGFGDITHQLADLLLDDLFGRLVGTGNI